MIDREQVEEWAQDCDAEIIAMGRILPSGAEISMKDLRELCRVYLAWLDAPEKEMWVSVKGLHPMCQAATKKRVRLVEVGE